MVTELTGALTPNDPFEITSTGLRLLHKPTFEEWVTFGRKLWSIRTAIQWCVGDWLAYGEGRGDWGETYAQAHEVTQYSERTLSNLAWVSDRVQMSRRREDLSHSHHEAVAKLEPTTQAVVLQKAASEKWSREDVREEANRIKPPKHSEPPKPSVATFEYIYELETMDGLIPRYLDDYGKVEELVRAHPDAVVSVVVSWTPDTKARTEIVS